MKVHPSVHAFVAAVSLLLLTPCMGFARQTPPLGVTVSGNDATFRVWAPFVDGVSVRINDGSLVSLTKETGHPNPADTIWVGTLPGVHAGDKYRYVVKRGNQTREFIDPRSRQVAGSSATMDSSVIVAPLPAMPPFPMPNFNEMVVYEMHVGTFHKGAQSGKFDFSGAIEKLGYLESMGINAIEVLPVHENVERPGNSPSDYNWGYDPVQLFAVERAYGAPRSFWEFVKRCHDHHIAVILDVVYNHFYEKNLLTDFGGFERPDISDGVYFYGGARNATGFGPRPDYGRSQVRDYIRDNALTWLRDYGVDGLRWDSTVNVRTFKKNDNEHPPIPEGSRLMREFNDAYRVTSPGKISIAEDLQGFVGVVTPTNRTIPGTSERGLGFNSQWDEGLYWAVRNAVTPADDGQRNVNELKRAIAQKFGDDAFRRIIYSENHDKVGHPNNQVKEIRLPRLIDQNNPESVFAKKRSTLAAAIILTSPGIPMLFQGQEMLDPNAFVFGKQTPLDWTRPERLPGMVSMYRDLIKLRRNQEGRTRGLTLQGVNVFHADGADHTLAYHRFGNGGAGDDVVVVANLSNKRIPALTIGFPRSGSWRLRFNSGAKVYDPTFQNGDSFDTEAHAGQTDGLGFNGDVSIGPYSVLIFSQD